MAVNRSLNQWVAPKKLRPLLFEVIATAETFVEAALRAGIYTTIRGVRVLRVDAALVFELRQDRADAIAAIVKLDDTANGEHEGIIGPGYLPRHVDDAIRMIRRGLGDTRVRETPQRKLSVAKFREETRRQAKGEPSTRLVATPFGYIENPEQLKAIRKACGVLRLLRIAPEKPHSKKPRPTKSPPRSRIKANTPKRGKSKNTNAKRNARFKIDRKKKKVKWGNQNLRLSDSEYDVFLALYDNRNQTVEHKKLNKEAGASTTHDAVYEKSAALRLRHVISSLSKKIKKVGCPWKLSAERSEGYALKLADDQPTFS